MSGPTYGADGLQIQTATEVQADVADALAAQFGAGFQGRNGQAVAGQAVSAVAQLLTDHQEGLDGAYQSQTIDGAAGVSLDRLALGLGLTRNAATATAVITYFVNGSGAAVTVPAGAIVQHTATGELFAVVASVTVGAGGSEIGNLRAVQTGPLAVAASAAWAWVTSFSGSTFVSLVNGTGATGTAEETDAALRIRILQSAHLPGSGTVASIRAALLDLDGVTYARVFENASDALGIAAPVVIAALPPHALVAVVAGNATGSDAGEDAIAAAIYARKPSGIATYGNTTRSVTDADGYAVPVKFEAATPAVFAVAAVFPLAVAAYETAIATALAAYVNGMSVGATVVNDAMRAVAFDACGVDKSKVTSFTLTFGVGGLGTANVVCDWNQYPTLATGDIAITFA